MNRRAFLGMFAAVPAACAMTGTGGSFPRWFAPVRNPDRLVYRVDDSQRGITAWANPNSVAHRWSRGLLAYCEREAKRGVFREIAVDEAWRILGVKQYTHDEFMALGRAFIRGPGSKYDGLIAREDELAAWDAAGRPDVTPSGLNSLTVDWLTRLGYPCPRRLWWGGM